MLFAVQDKKPYLISGGRAFPAELTEKGVKISTEEGTLTNLKGYLTESELRAKFPVKHSDKAEPLSEQPLTEEEPKRKRTRKPQPLTED